jgi:hypothetical protein
MRLINAMIGGKILLLLVALFGLMFGSLMMFIGEMVNTTHDTGARQVRQYERDNQTLRDWRLK